MAGPVPGPPGAAARRGVGDHAGVSRRVDPGHRAVLRAGLPAGGHAAGPRRPGVLQLVVPALAGLRRRFLRGVPRRRGGTHPGGVEPHVAAGPVEPVRRAARAVRRHVRGPAAGRDPGGVHRRPGGPAAAGPGVPRRRPGRRHRPVAPGERRRAPAQPGGDLRAEHPAPLADPAPAGHRGGAAAAARADPRGEPRPDDGRPGDAAPGWPPPSPTTSGTCRTCSAGG